MQQATIDPDAQFDPAEAGYEFLVGGTLGGLGGGVGVLAGGGIEAQLRQIREAEAPGKIQGTDLNPALIEVPEQDIADLAQQLQEQIQRQEAESQLLETLRQIRQQRETEASVDSPGTNLNSILTEAPGQDKIKIDIALEQPQPLATERVKQTMTAQAEVLREEQKQALRGYTGFAATRINGAIRLGSITPRIQEEIDFLDDALKDGVMPETVVLHRDTALSFLGLDLPGKPTAEELSQIVGRPITNRIFTSTSFINLGLPSRNTEIWLTVPAGYRGCRYLRSLASPKYKYQEEILFARGLKYRITDAKIENGKYVLFAEAFQ